MCVLGTQWYLKKKQLLMSIRRFNAENELAAVVIVNYRSDKSAENLAHPYVRVHQNNDYNRRRCAY